MSENLPQPTETLIKRLRRVATALGLHANGNANRERWCAFSNTCWQAAARLEELDAPRAGYEAFVKASAVWTEAEIADINRQAQRFADVLGEYQSVDAGATTSEQGATESAHSVCTSCLRLEGERDQLREKKESDTRMDTMGLPTDSRTAPTDRKGAQR